jgi:hypothetical protein
MMTEAVISGVAKPESLRPEACFCLISPFLFLCTYCVPPSSRSAMLVLVLRNTLGDRDFGGAHIFNHWWIPLDGPGRLSCP